jgi:hypothetical protein
MDLFNLFVGVEEKACVLFCIFTKAFSQYLLTFSRKNAHEKLIKLVKDFLKTSPIRENLGGIYIF